MPPRWRVWPIAVLLALAAACAPKRTSLPTGPGTPLPDFAAAYAEAVADCRTATTLKASLGLSGRAGPTKLRGHIDAGFSAPASIRLEGFPPLSFSGRPMFTLVARGESATLVLPRDQRVLQNAAPSAIVEALSGVPLGPAELGDVLTGCALRVDPTAGRDYGNGWAAVEAGPTTVYLRKIDGRWRPAGAARQSLQIQYGDYQQGRPATIHLRTTNGGSANGSDVTLKLTDVEVNTPLDAAVFELEVPRDASPITLDELRAAGPLGAGRTDR